MKERLSQAPWLAKVMLISLCLLSAGISYIVGEAGAKNKPKSRTLKELTDIVSKEGEPAFIDQYTANSLGFSKTRIPMKNIWYTADQFFDHRSHALSVVYSNQENRDGKPVAIIWQCEKSTMTKDGKFIDGEGFRLSPDGELQGAMKIVGIVRKTLKQTQLSLDSKEIKRAFQREKEFWLNKSVSVEWKNR